MVEPEEMPGALKTIVEQARRIGDVVKRLRQLENPTSVEYLGKSRMIDISPNRTGRGNSSDARASLSRSAHRPTRAASTWRRAGPASAG